MLRYSIVSIIIYSLKCKQVHLVFLLLLNVTVGHSGITSVDTVYYVDFILSSTYELKCCVRFLVQPILKCQKVTVVYVF